MWCASERCNSCGRINAAVCSSSGGSIADYGMSGLLILSRGERVREKRG